MSSTRADAPHRHLGLELAAHDIGSWPPAANTFSSRVRLDVARADRVDVDAVARDLERQRLGKADDAAPGRDREAEAGDRLDGRDRGDVEDAAAAARVHVWHDARAPCARHTSGSARPPWPRRHRRSSARSPSGGAPSLLTRMSMPPSSRAAVSTTRAQSSARRQSARIGSTSAPVSRAHPRGGRLQARLAPRRDRNARAFAAPARARCRSRCPCWRRRRWRPCP